MPKINRPSDHLDAIILQTVRYGDRDQIITAFSRELGIVKFITKRGVSHQSAKVTMLSPLTRVEIVYVKGRGELHRVREVMLLNSYSALREQLSLLQAGCELIEAIRQSQTGERAAPLLYDLMCIYLGHLQELHDVGTAVASFRLKILKHDGMLSDWVLTGLSDEEQLLVQLLAGCRRVADFSDVVLPDGFGDKIKQLFMKSL